MNESIKQIQARNHEKEIDKAWEVCPTRKLAIAFITYVSALVFLYIIKAPEPYLAALVPVGGFLLSTLTLKPLKKWWIDRQNQNT